MRQQVPDESGVFPVSWVEQEQRKYNRRIPMQKCQKKDCERARLPGQLRCIDHTRLG
jgi:hypothetical protein